MGAAAGEPPSIVMFVLLVLGLAWAGPVEDKAAELQHWREVLPPDHPDIAYLELQLAILHHQARRIDDARPLYEHAVPILRADPELSESDRLAVEQNWALFRAETGETEAAAADQAVACDEAARAFGAASLEVGVCLSNYSRTLRRQGDLEAARDAAERSVEVLEVADAGGRHLGIAKGDLASVLSALGDDAAALRMREEQLEQVGDLGTLAAWVTSLHESGRRAEAERAMRRLEARVSETHGADPPVEVYLLRSRLYAARGDSTSARAAAANARAALDIATRRGDDRTRLMAQAALADAKGFGGDPEGAAADHAALLPLAIERLGPFHPSVAGSHRMRARWCADAGQVDCAVAAADAALEAREHIVEAVLGVASERERLAFIDSHRRDLDQRLALDDAPSVWRHVVQWKGLAARGARPVADPALARVREQLATALLTADPDPDRIAALTAEKEALERAGARGAGARVEAAALCGVLGDAVLVDVLRTRWREVDRYEAFVVDRRCEPVRVSLGDAPTLDEALARYRRGLVAGVPDGTLDALAVGVEERVWAPVAARMGEAERVLFSPDSALHGLPLAALPDGTRRVGDTRVIAMLDAPSDLLRVGASGGEGALVVGGVDFGPGAEGGACGLSRFDMLDGSLREAEVVAGRLQDAQLLSGAAATEEALEAAIGGRRVVHLATHGFFAEGACRQQLAARLGPLAAHNPMVFSGLVAAGANADAGALWTAEEVASLDLRTVELVVLSACDSGRGDVASGQGVLGLRRAFALAGAGSVVMSLWPVDDAATVELMEAFYEHYEGDAPTALAEAQRQLARRLPVAAWAAFVASEGGGASRSSTP